MDGITATTTVAVGAVSVFADPMTDAGDWTVHTTGGAKATLSESTSQKPDPGDAGSLDVDYTIPAASGVSQIVFSPAGSHGVEISKLSSGVAPDAIGVWVKGIGGTPGTPLGNGELTFAESWEEANGTAETFYPTTVTYDGWRLVTAAIPPGTEFPLFLRFLDFLDVNPPHTTTGHVYLADLQALYPVRTPVTPAYTPLPGNPSWLRYASSPGRFSAGGVTIASFGDSHLTATVHKTTGSVVTNAIARDIKALPRAARTNAVQSTGNLADPGTLADDQYGEQVLASFGLAFHTAVGNSDSGQSWTTVFGPTHYSYTDGAAEFIVDDSSREGLLASDPYQVPAGEQYAWLVSRLDASTAKVIFVVTNASPYDPHPLGTSQFTGRHEAQMYEQLLARYQATHPGRT